MLDTANGGRPVLPAGAVRFNQRNQLCPRHDPIHFIQKLALARSLGDQLETGGSKAFLFHCNLTSERVTELTYADLP